jgi:hypothetical protein
MFDVYVSHLFAFLVGAATGAAGHYLGLKYTDKRRSQEQKENSRCTFNELNTRMPELFKEMRKDLLEDKSELVTEFVALPHRKIPFSSSKNSFYYFGSSRNRVGGF